MKPRQLTLAVAAAAALALMPAPSEAIAPALLFMVKQIAQQAATSMIKDTLLSSLSGMGCKGIALSNALSAMDMRGGGAGALLGGMPKMPGGLSMPTMPGMPAMPAMPGIPGMPGMPGMTGLPGGAGMSIPPELAAKMGAMVPGAGQLPPGMALDPQQMAMLANMQQMMSQPLSAAETVATMDELFELGFLPKAIQGEFKECMVLVPSTIPALGMGMGMLKPMIPQLRQARAEMRALSPAEQDEVAAALGQELKALPADQRSALLEYLDSGFFPPRVVAGARAAVGR